MSFIIFPRVSPFKASLSTRYVKALCVCVCGGGCVGVCVWVLSGCEMKRVGLSWDAELSVSDVSLEIGHCLLSQLLLG